MLSCDCGDGQGVPTIDAGQSERLDHIRSELKMRLSAPRYAHSVGVETTARSLAQRFGADEYVCALAGLLHDCARDLDEGCVRAIARDAGGMDADMPNAVLLHAPVGAYMAVTEFGVDDPRVLSAIRNHTAGEPGMGLDDKIVCLADYTEPGRDFPEVRHLRELSLRSIDGALAAALEGSVRHIAAQSGPGADDDALARTRSLIAEIKKSQEVGESTVGQAHQVQ